MNDERAQDAADGAVDPDRLLPGEDDTLHPDDPSHWISVYSELLAFKEAVIRETASWLERLTTEATREVQATDMRVLEAEAARFRRRLAHWQTQAHGNI